MGIGFGATAKTLSSNGKALSRADTFAAIRKAIEDSCDDPFLAKLVEFGEGEHELAVVLYPGAEAVFFTWDPAGTIAADSKTSTAGPGYHAYAVEVVKAVGQRCGLNWAWEDEAEYAPGGDFESVKEHMRQFLRAMAGSFLEPPGREFTMAVNMSLGAPVPVGNGPFTITPLGPRDRRWWEDVKRGKDLDSAARGFFPWWDPERTAAFYRNTGLVLLWSEVRWGPPMSEAEEAQMNLAIECFERAAELDPDMNLPDKELEELRVLLNLEEEDEVPEPAPDGIGYYRAVINRTLPGPWHIQLPGYWQETFDEETGCLTIFHNERAVHVTTYGFDSEPGQPPPNPNEVASYPDEMPEAAKKVEFKKDGRIGRGFIVRTEEEGEEGIILQGTVAQAEGMANITIWYEDEDDRAWAVEVFESLSGRGGNKE
jgi:hypothetical protein